MKLKLSLIIPVFNEQENIRNLLNSIIENSSDDYDIEIEPENNETHVIKNCPNCQTKIRLQKGKVGTITCPSCQRKVYTSTK